MSEKQIADGRVSEASNTRVHVRPREAELFNATVPADIMRTLDHRGLVRYHGVQMPLEKAEEFGLLPSESQSPTPSPSQGTASGEPQELLVTGLPTIPTEQEAPSVALPFEQVKGPASEGAVKEYLRGFGKTGDAVFSVYLATGELPQHALRTLHQQGADAATFKGALDDYLNDLEDQALGLAVEAGVQNPANFDAFLQRPDQRVPVRSALMRLATFGDKRGIEALVDSYQQVAGHRDFVEPEDTQTSTNGTQYVERGGQKVSLSGLRMMRK